VIGSWLAAEGPGVLEDRGAAFDQHTVYGDASVLDTPLLLFFLFFLLPLSFLLLWRGGGDSSRIAVGLAWRNG